MIISSDCFRRRARRSGRGRQHGATTRGQGRGAIAAFSALLVLGGCGAPAADGTEEQSGSTADTPMPVTVSILPQQAFAERIGGKHVDVTVMVPPGAEPATYEPRPGQLSGVAESRAYFSIGVPFERAWLPRFRSANAEMPVVDTAKKVQRKGFANGQPDPHIWMDPQRVAEQAGAYADTFAELDPEHEQFYRSNLESFRNEISALDRDLSAQLEPYSGRAVMLFHPVLNYFAQRYGLQAINIQDGGDEPSASDLQRLAATARKSDVGVIFVEPQFSQSASRRLADQVGARVETLDPLAADWQQNLREVGDQLAGAFSENR